MSNSYFGHGMTLYATKSVMAQTSSWLVYSHHSKLLFFVFSKLHPSTSLNVYFTACLFCAPETLNTTTDRGLFWNQTVY